MKPTRSFKQGVAKVRRLWLAEKNEQALAEVSRLLEEWPDNPFLLILWADLVQLQDADKGPNLEDAKKAYRHAVDLDDQSPAALIELGKYLHAVEDQPGSAAKCFAKAAALAKQLLKEALLAQAESLSELERAQDALACLAEAYWLQSHNGKSAEGSGESEILERLKGIAYVE